MKGFHPRLAIALGVTGLFLIAIFSSAALILQRELRQEVRDKIIERDAAVLSPVAEAQLREAEADPGNHAFVSEMLLPSVMKTVRGMRGVAIYDAEGNLLQTSPASLHPTDIPPDDYARLVAGEQISHFQPEFPIDRFFADERNGAGPTRWPMLEVLLPLRAGDSGQPVGYVRYFIDAQPLAGELARIDGRVNRQTVHTLTIGSALILLVLLGAYLGLARAQRIIAERNERLTRANFELTLAAKTSALGVITSHLIHGLQGPVAGLRAVMADHAEGLSGQSEWQSAADYTERMQTMIHETVALLGDAGSQTSYELTGTDLASTIRERNSAAAIAKSVVLTVETRVRRSIDSHRGSLICLVATNLVQNALEATDPGRHVNVMLQDDGTTLLLRVSDEGHGIPESLREHLFEPGRTGRAGGTGLGLAISRLIARQIGATLELTGTSPAGTTFQLQIPLVA